MLPIQPYNNSKYDLTVPLILGSAVVVGITIFNFFKIANEKPREDTAIKKQISQIQKKDVKIEVKKVLLVEAVETENTHLEIPSNNTSLVEVAEIIEEIIGKILLEDPCKKEDADWVSVGLDGL